MESFVIRIKKISRCRICNSKNLNKILKIKNMPFTDQFLLKKSLGDEFKEDIEIFICNDCSVTQTLKDVEVDDYYNDYQYSVGKSSIANNFLKKLSNNINKLTVSKNLCLLSDKLADCLELLKEGFNFSMFV